MVQSELDPALKCEVMSAVKILVVDDEPGLLALIVEWLEDDGCEVYSATDATEGLQLFFQHKPALAITDLVMPGMDGFQFISRIREMSDAHVLVLTALDSAENMIRGLELGADEYLVKPVSRRTFLARVRSILRRAISDEKVLPVYSDDALRLDYLNHEIQVRGEMVYLRPTEFRLLATLIQNSDRLAGSPGASR